MKKLLVFLLAILMIVPISGCALTDLFHNNDNVVDLGNGDSFVRWTLIDNDNRYRPVNSAYFEFNKNTFKYYEDGKLKKEGTHRITFYDINENNAPLHLNLEFGKDEKGFSVFDYVDCYTEDKKENLNQFTIVSEGYHVETVRSGGVPVRDYHLSEMPYAFGTYVKDGESKQDYVNGKVNYIGCAKLDGTFYDENGNMFYFVNNSYSAKYKSADYSKYTVYMRYENNQNNTYLEGTIKLSYNGESYTDKDRKDLALIHVLRGENEPGEEKGTYEMPDYKLNDFTFVSDNQLILTSAEYFYDNRECDFNPLNIVSGTYYKTND